MRDFPKHPQEKHHDKYNSIFTTKKDKKIWDLEYQLEYEKWYRRADKINFTEQIKELKEKILEDNKIEREKYNFFKEWFEKNNLLMTEISEERKLIDNLINGNMLDVEIINIPKSSFLISYATKNKNYNTQERS